MFFLQPTLWKLCKDTHALVLELEKRLAAADSGGRLLGMPRDPYTVQYTHLVLGRFFNYKAVFKGFLKAFKRLFKSF